MQKWGVGVKVFVGSLIYIYIYITLHCMSTNNEV